LFQVFSRLHRLTGHLRRGLTGHLKGGPRVLQTELEMQMEPTTGHQMVLGRQKEPMKEQSLRLAESKRLQRRHEVDALCHRKGHRKEKKMVPLKEKKMVLQKALQTVQD
jgi:hypothetical protein